jgi:hypothetical protein
MYSFKTFVSTYETTGRVMQNTTIWTFMPLEFFALRLCKRVYNTHDVSRVKLGNFHLCVGFAFITAMIMNKCIFWAITLGISFKVSQALLATVSCKFLSCFLLWPWRYVPPKRQSTFTGLHSVRRQKIHFFHLYVYLTRRLIFSAVLHKISMKVSYYMLGHFNVRCFGMDQARRCTCRIIFLLHSFAFV